MNLINQMFILYYRIQYIDLHSHRDYFIKHEYRKLNYHTNF